jgi:hypothetical protein
VRPVFSEQYVGLREATIGWNRANVCFWFAMLGKSRSIIMVRYGKVLRFPRLRPRRLSNDQSILACQ